ncbi:hypothetical protein GWO43_05085 [candidate division KSB1 bacterium]|nr:hypothetical protein [candidate division KSB1 bacterium]NIR71458.1 hypothetical protein [candidate division KSB1 bacterium]NIS23379.1 hypothetical protein [candidate division KSB1 bacterium]NIT70270.1 hypothetical protein [candidate division KSB1 bacterium]NIU23993.1 hypothetical protein [candidate division KSB1 bacterium]
MANPTDTHEQANLARMLQEANRDPNLMRELFKEPTEVAKRYKVNLTPHQVEKLESAGKFLDTLRDINFGRIEIDPVFYPVNKMLVREIRDLIFYPPPIRRYPIWYPGVYPAPFYPGPVWRGFRR